MSTTIKELAAKLHIKRTAVEMRMKHIPNFREKYTVRKGNRLIINDAGSRLLSGLKHDKEHVKYNDIDTVNVNTLTVKTLKELLQQERAHNSQLSKQLDNVNKGNDKLADLLKHQQTLLNQQQELELSDKRQNKDLRGKIKHLKEIPGHVDTSKDKSVNPVRKQKLSFWQKLVKLFS